MIDINKAKKYFKKYVSNYDKKNVDVCFKTKHTFKVSNVSKKTAQYLGLDKENVQLAELIGLLHDIGRFEQIKQYATLSDLKSIDHGQLGVDILFKDNFIRNFIDTDKYDEIIKVAIFNHNKYAIQEGLGELELLHCKIIRDADKTDIYRVLNKRNFTTYYAGVDFSKDKISEDVFLEFMNRNQIKHQSKKTIADAALVNIAFIFDMNFKYGLVKIKRKKYLEKLAKKYNFTNEDTVKKMDEALKNVNEYINQVLKK